MTDYFVGPGGSDTENGLTWATRKLTLNGAEDVPVAAGDTVYVGPGVYRESLTVDVSGSSGNPVTYIGDVTGENTDDIGGIVRITGSDNDDTGTRNECVIAIDKDYRTFRGFMFDGSLNRLISATSGCTNWIIEDSSFMDGSTGIYIEGADQSDWIVRRCWFFNLLTHIDLIHSADVSDTDHLIENCVFLGAESRFIGFTNVGDTTIKDCLFLGNASIGVYTIASPGTGAGQFNTVNNSIFIGNRFAVLGQTLGDLVEDYNNFTNNENDRTTVNVGGNSDTAFTIYLPPVLYDGIVMPLLFGNYSEWSTLARKAGTGEPTDDLFGIVRPTVSAKKSWGPIQLREPERETGTVQTGSAALTLADAGDHQIYVPVTATSTTFEVAARYESEYAGTLPRLIVRQPGQADQVDTMVAAADTWETLSLTFTPNATPPYVVIILRSLNTSVTGDFDTYWDDLDIS